MEAGPAHDDASPAGFRGAIPERSAERRRLTVVLLVTAGFMVVELVAGLLASSLALLADAGHMFTDAGSLGLSLFALWIAQRPGGSEKTFGYLRTEILAALVNGATLIVIALFIVREAYERFLVPRDVNAPILMGTAVVGLGVNLVGARLLHAHAHDSLNVKGAYLHVLGDLLGSVGALAAGAVIWTTGWDAADPLISVVIAVLILVSAWRLVRESVDVLMESAPAHIDVEAIREALGGIDGLDEIHDLHVWTVTSGFVAMSGHGVVEDPAEQSRVLDEINRRMEEQGIHHVTFQLEPRTLHQLDGELPGGRPGAAEDDVGSA